jgi:hypothetical protein
MPSSQAAVGLTRAGIGDAGVGHPQVRDGDVVEIEPGRSVPISGEPPPEAIESSGPRH